jgi:hypothetical protein
MTSKQPWTQLAKHPSLKEPGGGNSMAGNAMTSAKFEPKQSLQMKDEVPVWEFLECNDELITFAEKDRRCYSLAEKNPNCVVCVNKRIRI